MSRPLGGGLVLIVAVLISGCGGGAAKEGGATGRTKGVKFVGFDASSRLVEAVRDGKLLGTVVQDPFKMGNRAVKTMVAHLEKKKVEPQISTGETLLTPENIDTASIRPLIDPPKVGHGADSVSAARTTNSYRLMVIPKGTTHEFWQTIHAGASKAAKELGNVDLIWQGPAKEDDRGDQIKLVQNAIALEVDGIILAPLDGKALVEPVEAAVRKGIPVVIIDSALESKAIVSYVATDNHHGGVLAARRLGELLGGEGRIILLRYAEGSESTVSRERGFTETIAKEFPRITYLSDDQYAGATSDLAQQKAQNLITRYRGQVEGVFCPNESSTLGMLRVLEGAGLLAGKP